jgi:hypothetical protein
VQASDLPSGEGYVCRVADGIPAQSVVRPPLRGCGSGILGGPQSRASQLEQRVPLFALIPMESRFNIKVDLWLTNQTILITDTTCEVDKNIDNAGTFAPVSVLPS